MASARPQARATAILKNRLHATRLPSAALERLTQLVVSGLREDMD